MALGKIVWSLKPRHHIKVIPNYANPNSWNALYKSLLTLIHLRLVAYNVQIFRTNVVFGSFFYTLVNREKLPNQHLYAKWWWNWQLVGVSLDCDLLWDKIVCIPLKPERIFWLEVECRFAFLRPRSSSLGHLYNSRCRGTHHEAPAYILGLPVGTKKQISNSIFSCNNDPRYWCYVKSF